MLQSELEDLCFATLDPECYRKLYHERNELWQKKLVSPAVLEEADRALARSQVWLIHLLYNLMHKRQATQASNKACMSKVSSDNL